MKKIMKLLGLLFLLLIIYGAYVTTTTGFFRSIENSYSGDMVSITIPGAEDFAIAREAGFLIISSDDRAARRDGKETVNGLYYMDLENESYEPELIRAPNDVSLFPHGISMIPIDSNTFRLLVVNHVTSGSEAVSSMDPNTKHSIEEYVLRDKELRFVKTHADELIRSPNDVVAIDESRFYFTNDHGSKTTLGLAAEDYLGFRRSDVIYFDGSKYHIVDTGIAYANGINYDASKDILYVASPRDFLVKTYHVLEDGTLDFQTDIDCGTGVDNIELDPAGKLWIGCHPNLLSFTSYAGGGSEFAPSEIITINYNNKDSYEVRSVFESDGSDMSAATTAIPYEGKVFVGNVMDGHFIILDQHSLK